MEIRSFAKINLFLQVTGKRADGYHELNTLMCGIDLHDIIRLDFNCAETCVSCTHPDVPGDLTNTAFKAARLFFETAGIAGAVGIHIEKRIPVGAGLGGGSSNAAAVLKELNTHYGNPLSEGQLMAMGRAIGADVCFFISGRPAVATGIGEVLTPFLHLYPFQLLVIYPSVPVSTAQVYKKLNLGLTKNKKIPKKNVFELNWKKADSVCLHNDLEETGFALCPESRRAKMALLRHHASAALMSGSGSAVFGLYETTEAARDAHAALSENKTWQIYLTRLRT